MFLPPFQDWIYSIEVVIVLFFGYLLSSIVIPRISLVSFRRRLFDSIDERKIHTAPIPRLGGISFFPSIMMTLSIVITFHNLTMGENLLDLLLTTSFFTLIGCLFLLYLMGIMDDLIGVRYRIKFYIQIICGILIVSTGLYIDDFHGLFGLQELPALFSMPFTVLIIVYVLNAINLIDGIDGLASGLSLIAFLAFGCMFVRLQWWFYAFIAFASMSVLIPFFYYNVFGKVDRGRKIFMGDTGSLTIGLLLATLAIRLSKADPVKETLIPSAIVIAFSFLIVPMLDVVRVVIHRLRNGKSPFLPDKNHIHHKFMALGLPQRKAMISIVTIAFIFALLNVLLIYKLSTTMLFLLDVGIWTVMHIYLTHRINQRTGIKK